MPRRSGRPRAAAFRSSRGNIEWTEFHEKVRSIVPANDAQRALQAKIIDLVDDLAETRWLLTEQAASSIQTPFLLVVVLWLGIIFASFGLFAPRNWTVYSVIVPVRAFAVDGRLPHPRARPAVQRLHPHLGCAAAAFCCGKFTAEAPAGVSTVARLQSGPVEFHGRTPAVPVAMRILLVEDDPMIGKTLHAALQRDGYAVDWVKDGQAAKLALDTTDDAYALVLLDLGLPKKSGLELLREVRRARQQGARTDRHRQG